MSTNTKDEVMTNQEAVDAGARAYHDGAPRVMPLAEFILPNGAMDKPRARAWYRGWDAANLCDPS